MKYIIVVFTNCLYEALIQLFMNSASSYIYKYEYVLYVRLREKEGMREMEWLSCVFFFS